MKTLEELLRMKVTINTTDGNTTPEFSPDFRVAVQNIHHDGVHIIVHPLGHNGETLDLFVRGNQLSNVLRSGE